MYVFPLSHTKFSPHGCFKQPFSSFSPLCEKEHPSGTFGQLAFIHVDVVGLLPLPFFFIIFAIIGFFSCNKKAASVALLPLEVARPSNMASIASLFDSTIVAQFSATTMINVSRNHCDIDVFIFSSVLLLVQRHLQQLISTRVACMTTNRRADVTNAVITPYIIIISPQT